MRRMLRDLAMYTYPAALRVVVHLDLLFQGPQTVFATSIIAGDSAPEGQTADTGTKVPIKELLNPLAHHQPTSHPS